MAIPYQSTLLFRTEGNITTHYSFTEDIQKNRIDTEYFNEVSEASSGLYQVRFTGNGRVFIKLPELITPLIPFQRDNITSELRLSSFQYYQTRIKVWVRDNHQNLNDSMTFGIINDQGDVLYGWGLFYDHSADRWAYRVINSGVEQFLGSEAYYSPTADEIYEVIMDVWKRDPDWGIGSDYVRFMWRLYTSGNWTGLIIYESNPTNILDYNNMRVGVVVNGSTLQFDYIRVIQGMGVW